MVEFDDGNGNYESTGGLRIWALGMSRVLDRRIERETLNLNREGQRFKNVLANYATQKYSVLIILKNNPASTPHIVLFLLVKAVVIAVARKSTVNRNDLSSNISSSRQAQKG